MNNNIKWICDNGKLDMNDIYKVENIFGIKFPKDYVKCILYNNGGYPTHDRFILNGNEEILNNLVSLDEKDSNNILDIFNDIKEHLIKNLIPFAEDPFGNLLCFDYRNNSQPSIVFWEHEKAFNDKEMAITYLCISFTELISILYESKED